MQTEQPSTTVSTNATTHERSGRPVIVVTGATGNLGSAVVPSLLRAGYDVVAISRHPPDREPWRREPWQSLDGVRWCRADLAVDPLDPRWFADACAVVHLAWLIQPSHRQDVLFAANVKGTRRLVDATVTAGVPQLVHLSSVGAYRLSDEVRVADETYPTDGSPWLGYAWQKAYVERMLDAVAGEHPEMTVTRLRSALIFQGSAARRIHGLFSRPLPRRLVGLVASKADRAPIPFQVVHADDVASAIVLAIRRRAGGAFNLASAPVLGRRSPAARRVVRSLAGVAGVAWRLRLVAAEPGWLRLAAGVPEMDTTRARDVLGWSPRLDALATLDELARGLRSRPEPPRPADGSNAPIGPHAEPPAPVPRPS